MNFEPSSFSDLKSFSFLAAIFVKEEDIAAYTIKAADDPRTLNKIVYLRPPANTLSYNEMVSLWEKKIGKTLEKIYTPEAQLLKNIQGQARKIAQKSIFLENGKKKKTN